MAHGDTVGDGNVQIRARGRPPCPPPPPQHALFDRLVRTSLMAMLRGPPRSAGATEPTKGMVDLFGVQPHGIEIRPMRARSDLRPRDGSAVTPQPPLFLMLVLRPSANLFLLQPTNACPGPKNPQLSLIFLRLRPRRLVAYE